MSLELFIEHVKNDKNLRKFIYKPDELHEALLELKQIIGLQSFKDSLITKLQTWIKTKDKIERGEIKQQKDRYHTLLTGPVGCGKCLSPEQEVLMFSGEIKQAKDILPGDKLMGDDSKEKNVLTITSGEEEMFEIVPELGRSFKCNKSHILTLYNKSYSNYYKNSLTLVFYDKLEKKSMVFENMEELKNFKKTITSQVFDVPLSEYLESKENIATLIQTSVEFPEIVLDKNPYNIGYYSVQKGFLNSNEIINSRCVRHKILGGVLDSGCELCPDKIILKRNPRLCKDIEFLANSLGYLCLNLGEELHLYGDLRKIPFIISKRDEFPKKNGDCLYQSFKVVPLGVGKYSGFELDGNGRFLLSDFKITHNTSIAKILCKIWLSMGFIKKGEGTKKELKSFDELQHRLIGDNKKEIKKLKAQINEMSGLLRNVYKINTTLNRILANLIREESSIPKKIYSDLIGNLSGTVKIVNDNSEHMKNILSLKNESSFDYPAIIDPKKKNTDKVSEEGLPFYILKRSDVVSRYVGGSTHDTREILTKCLDGVVYFDEAYNLYNPASHGDQYGQEALTEINQFMDEHADRIIFIFSGYKDRIYESFEQGQEGILSRFDQRFDIEGYSSDELTQILISEMKKAGYILTDAKELRDLIKENFDLFEFFGRDMNSLSMYIRNKVNTTDFYTSLGKKENISKNISIEEVKKGIDEFKKNKLVKTETTPESEIKKILDKFVQAQAS